MIGNVTFLWKRSGPYWNTFGTEHRFDHIGYVFCASAGTKVSADSVLGISISFDPIALSAMQPIEYFNGNPFKRLQFFFRTAKNLFS